MKDADIDILTRMHQSAEKAAALGTALVALARTGDNLGHRWYSSGHGFDRDDMPDRTIIGRLRDIEPNGPRPRLEFYFKPARHGFTFLLSRASGAPSA